MLIRRGTIQSGGSMTRALKLSLTALTGAAVLAAAALWWLNRPASITIRR